MSDDDAYIVPCENPENDADDWFLERDGKQYPDEELLTDDDRLAILEEANGLGLEGTERVEFIEAVEDDLEAEVLKRNLQRRRHARDKCHVECYFRTQCLTIALTKPEPSHGTWGGYYPEELKQIRTLRDKREKTRASRDADVGSEE